MPEPDAPGFEQRLEQMLQQRLDAMESLLLHKLEERIKNVVADVVNGMGAQRRADVLKNSSTAVHSEHDTHPCTTSPRVGHRNNKSLAVPQPYAPKALGAFLFGHAPSMKQLFSKWHREQARRMKESGDTRELFERLGARGMTVTTLGLHLTRLHDTAMPADVVRDADVLRAFALLHGPAWFKMERRAIWEVDQPARQTGRCGAFAHRSNSSGRARVGGFYGAVNDALDTRTPGASPLLRSLHNYGYASVTDFGVDLTQLREQAQVKLCG